MGRKRHENDPAETPPSPDAGESTVEPETLSEQDAAIAERDEWKDRYHRALADAENARKRHQRERDESRQYAVAELARELLGVLDNLTRAVEGVPADQQDDPLATGVRLVLSQLETALKSHGVEPIEAFGTPFDPMHHEAIQQEERDDVPPGTVVDELIRGYRIKDRLLRASVVRVSKAGPGAAAGGGESPKTGGEPSAQE